MDDDSLNYWLHEASMQIRQGGGDHLADKVEEARSTLAASERRCTELEKGREFSNHVVNEQAMLNRTLQARLDGAEKLVAKWRYEADTIPDIEATADVECVVRRAADQLEAILAAPLSPTDREGAKAQELPEVMSPNEYPLYLQNVDEKP